MRESERAAQVVRFWRTIEMFSPQSVPKLTFDSREDSGKMVLDLAADEVAPWQPDHPVRAAPLRDGMTWQFTVYGGLYEIAAARTEMVRVFGEDSKPDDARKDGQTAMFAFTLDVEGCLVENSATLSACAWAISRLKSPGPRESTWLDGFELHEREFVAGLNKLVPPKAQDLANAGQQNATQKRVGKAVGEHVKGAAVEAVTAGAKATGVAVTAAVGAGVGSVAGPVVGGIAGTVAGTFAEKLLTPGAKNESGPDETAAAEPPQARIPRLRMTARTLHEFTEELGSELGIRDVLHAVGVRVACIQVPVRNSDQAGEQNFLNSFIASDLAQVEKAVRGADIGDGLAAYLTDSRHIQTAHRVDVRAGRHTLISGVVPRRIPGGRWPTSTAKPLVVSQQFAVNQIFDELGESAGLFAVNGPPGTGKTTMLRDVLAGLVVERARRLVDLDDPSKAFTEVLQRIPLSKTYSPAVWGIRPELTGFEVVVATASNDAAANVTAEIPSLDAVRGAEDDALAIDYFTDLASHVLGGKAWGMVAAVLGNMKNRSAFASRFWWGDEAGKKKEQPVGLGPSSAARPEEPLEDPENVGMLAILKQVREQPDDIEDWGDAVASFQEAEAEVRRLTVDRQDAADAITEAFRCQTAIHAAERQVRDAHVRCEQLRESVGHSVVRFDESKAAYDSIDVEYQNHPNHKPGFWISLSTGFRAGRRWANRHRELEDQRSAAKSSLDQLSQAVSESKAHLATVLQERQRYENALNDAKHALAIVETRINIARERWPGRVPFGSDVADDEAFQLCAPWADQEFTAARNRLFLAALSLHKAFLFNTEPQVRGNLAVITAAVRGKVNMKPSTLVAAWQSLFLVVPMISTTFASLPRLFAGLSREALGWLFIDEAGQATPQQAVGGLWRCRRAVIVGDPQQLEPIVTLPLPAQQTLLRHHGVHDQWTPDNTSTQRIADRLARHGTALPEPDGESRIWVGAPLRVHRRCDRPMFDISNTIAYGGDLMVYGTNHSGDYPGANAWIDVRSGQSRGNWVPAEGDALKDLLGKLAGEGVLPRDIRVISPFRDVVRGSKEIVRRNRKVLLPSFDRHFVDKNVGTVHTVQGQESDVIVLVLGSAPERPRARAWAAEKPNLLNVAASRAKRRLYVIGNRDNWKDLRYFNVLAKTLPVELELNG